MAARRKVRFGIIGLGLMGREFGSAIARWCHLLFDGPVPELAGICDTNPASHAWFAENFPTIRTATTRYEDLLAAKDIEAIYCAVPHILHRKLYVDIISAGKHLMGEKPFGIDKPANDAILAAIAANPKVFVRCSSEFPYFPAVQRIIEWITGGKLGRIIEVRSGFHHSSDMDVAKPINWKRMVEVNGEYGCMGDLGIHTQHVPFRMGWIPKTVHASLSKIVTERPDGKGGMTPCETWDNAILACEVQTAEQHFPMLISTKRIAPGEGNTWFIKVHGTEFSAEFSTKYPKTLRTMNYRSGKPQSWETQDIGYSSAYPTITGGIFEPGFPDLMQQMWAAFLLERAGRLDGRGAEVDEQVVPDDHLRCAHGRADGAASVGHVALENIVGDDVLAGAEGGVGLVAVRGSEVAHRHRARIPHVVADELDEPRRAFPGTAAHVHDAALQYAGVLGPAHHVVEGVARRVVDGTAPVGDPLRIGPAGLDGSPAGTARHEALARHPAGVAVLDQHPLRAADADAVAVLQAKAPDVRRAAGVDVTGLVPLVETHEAGHAEVAERHLGPGRHRAEP